MGVGLGRTIPSSRGIAPQSLFSDKEEFFLGFGCFSFWSILDDFGCFRQESELGLWLMAELVSPQLYSCSNCRNHVCLHDDVISKTFHVKFTLLVALFAPIDDREHVLDCSDLCWCWLCLCFDSTIWHRGGTAGLFSSPMQWTSL